MPKGTKLMIGHDIENGWQNSKDGKLSVLRHVGFYAISYEKANSLLEIRELIEAEKGFYTLVMGWDLAQFLMDLMECLEDFETPTLFIAHNHNYELDCYFNQMDMSFGKYQIDCIAKSSHNILNLSYKIGKQTVAIFRDSKLLYPSGQRALKKITEKAPSNIKKLDGAYDYGQQTLTKEDCYPKDNELEYNYVDCLGTLWAYANAFAINETYIDTLPILWNTTNHFEPNLLPLTQTGIANKIATCMNMFNIIEEEKQKKRPSYRSYKLIEDTFSHNWQAFQKNAKKLASKLNIPNEEMYSFFRKACGGGIITYRADYRDCPCENVMTFDLSSAYPYTITAKYFPYSNWEWVDEKHFDYMIKRAKLNAWDIINRPEAVQSEHLLFSGVDGKSPKSWTGYVKLKGVKAKTPIYIMPTSKIYNARNMNSISQKLYSMDEGCIYTSYEDLCLYIALYDIENIEILQALSYTMRPMPKYWSGRFNACYNEKARLKKIKDEYPIDYKNAKARLNAMYGLTYMNTLRPVYVYEDRELNMDTAEYKTDSIVVYPLGAYISQWNRVNIVCGLCYALNKGHCPIYIHTDSMKFNDLYDKDFMNDYNKFLDTVEFVNPSMQGTGTFDYEDDNHFAKACVFGNGKIIGIGFDDNLHVTWTGVSSKYIKKLYDPKDSFYKNCTKLADLSITGDIGKTSTDYSRSGIYLEDIGVYTFGVITSVNGFTLRESEQELHTLYLSQKRFENGFEWEENFIE